MKIYTITHKEFIPPKDPLYVPLHVGHVKFSDGTLPVGTTDYGYMGDDTGDNISYKNNLYGELTGLYWIWKNAPADDYEGLVHYRRFFADKDGKILGESALRDMLKESDILIGEHIEYEVSYEEKFAEYHHAIDLVKTGEAIKKLYPDYYETFEEVIHSRQQYVFNMMITSKELLNAYAKWLFDICFELENTIDVSGYDNYHARIYGFLSEELLYVWIKHNGLKYKELPVIYSQEKAETIEFKKNLKLKILEEGFEAAHEYFMKMFKERPDLTLEDSDFTQELRIILYILTYSDRFKDRLNNKYFDDYLKRFSAVDALLSELVQEGELTSNERLVTGLRGVTEDELEAMCSVNKSFQENKALLVNALKTAKRETELSVLVLNYAEEQEGLLTTVDSLLNQSFSNLFIEIIDAVGNAKELIKTSSKLVIRDLSTVDFENLSVLKDEAVKGAKNNLVCIVEAGTAFDKRDFEDVMNAPVKSKTECFDEVISAGVSAVALMIYDKRATLVVGGFNEKLGVATEYELALRICDCDYSEAGVEELRLIAGEVPVYQETFETYAYCISKYATRLKEKGLFDSVFTSVYQQANGYGIGDFFVRNAEEFMSKGERFQMVDEATRPFLILKGENICRGILDFFADNLAKGFEKIGQNVVLHDINDGGLNAMLELAKRDYKAVIGFQTELFSMQLPDKDVLGNKFNCKKLQWTFDHPLYFSYHIMVPIRELYLCSQDGNYAAYAKKYFPYVKDAWHVSPAGNIYGDEVDVAKLVDNKRYNISFVGAFNDYRDRLVAIRVMESEERRIALKLINVLKHNPDMTIEEGLMQVLRGMGKGDISDHDFVILMHHMREVGRLMSFYFRERVVCELLKAGIDLDVFSTLWESFPMAGNEHLHIHEDVSYEEGLRVMQESRISLNVMSWHKDGMTERIANSMLNGSICLTDKTKYITENFEEGKECFTFELTDLDSMIRKVEGILSMSQEEQVNICLAAYDKASMNHTWEARARQVVELI